MLPVVFYPDAGTLGHLAKKPQATPRPAQCIAIVGIATLALTHETDNSGRGDARDTSGSGESGIGSSSHTKPTQSTGSQATQLTHSKDSETNAKSTITDLVILTDSAARFEVEASTAAGPAYSVGLIPAAKQPNDADAPQYATEYQATIEALKAEITSLTEAKSEHEELFGKLQTHLLETKMQLASKCRELESAQEQLAQVKGMS